jgi:diguanylate cyclase (GGDEF)-like protein/PAS domain S-box-containing protein
MPSNHVVPPNHELADQSASWRPTLAFLRYAIVTIVVGSACYVTAVLAFTPEHLGRAYGPMVMILVALAAAWLLRKERTEPAILLLVCGIWLIIFGIAIFRGGVKVPIYYAHPLLVFLLGWLVSARAAAMTAGLTVAGTIGLVLAEAWGWLPQVVLAPSALHGIVQIFIIVLATAMVNYLVQAYRRQLDAVRRTNEVLRQSELKFATAFASSPVTVSIATLEEGRILEVNPNFERDFGWSRAEVLGRTAVEVGLWQASGQRAEFSDLLRRQGRVVNYETMWLHKNGSLRQISVSGVIVDIDGASCILAYTTDITERKEAEEQIQRLAFYDPLTSLPNRRLLMDRLGHAMAACVRHQQTGALLFIDLDNFKTLNDTHGHDKGDLLLKEVASRLMDCVREGDTVARLGGDEFVVMLEDLSGKPDEAARQAEVVGRKVLATLNEHYDIAPLRVHSTPSVGITLFGAQHENIEEPIKRADLAMYQAKSAGRNTLRFFDPRMQAMVSARAEMERDLRLALQLGQFSLHFQPQVQRAGEVCGVEALLRWQHPQRGAVPPGEFIPVAEETGLILPLGDDILRQACEQLARWADQPDMAHLTLSVNVSPRQFQQDNFVARVLGVLDRTGAPAQQLKLELTESLLITNVDEVIAKMDAIKARGVGFSLDDFGTGYSSLSYLKRLPLDQLKIDQGFVRDILVDPNDAAIARMVVVLAESLGLEVMAEGVETPEQQQALQAQGCHAYQGYLYSHPLPVEEFEALARQPGWPLLPGRAPRAAAGPAPGQPHGQQA